MTASGIEFLKYVAMEAFPSGKRSLSIPFCHGKSCMLNPWSRFVLYLNMLSLELSQNTERFPWNGESEDIFFCHAAADIFDELPRSIQPAPMTEENEFCAETTMFQKPFALHQFWPHLHANTPHDAAAMLENCPEGLGIIPQEVLLNDGRWKQIVCGLNISYGETSLLNPNTSCLLRQICPNDEILNPCS